MIVELPSFTPLTSCPVESHPVPVVYAVTAVLNNGLLVCGGKIISVSLASLQLTKILYQNYNPQLLDQLKNARVSTFLVNKNILC